MSREIVVYAQPPSGSIEQYGAGLARGVWPEGYQSQHDEHGPLACQFALRRIASVQWPDLLPGTPMWITADGVVEFQGRLAETPARSGGSDDQLGVVCEGWQAHLADDANQRSFVAADLTAWVDARVKPSVSLGTWTTTSRVQTGDGTILIDAVNGSAQGPGVLQGVVLDMGPDAVNKAQRIVLNYDHSASPAANANWSVTMRVTDSSDLTGGVTSTATFAAGATVTLAYSPATPGRFVVVYIERTGGAATLTGDIWLRLNSVQVFTRTTYESANASILKASDVIAAALVNAPLLSQDTSRITATSFNIPHLVGPRDSARTLIEQVNAYHLYQWFVDLGSGAGDAGRLIFRPIPTTPTLVAPIGDGVEFADASRNALAELYNACTVEYTDAAGNPAAVSRVTADTAAPAWFPSPDQIVNAGFETGAVASAATGWSGPGTMTIRAPGDATAQAGEAATDGTGLLAVSTSASTKVTAGRRYRLQLRVNRLAGWTGTTNLVFQVNDAGSPFVTLLASTSVLGSSLTVGTWATVTVDFTATSTGRVSLSIVNGAALPISTAIVQLDNVTILDSRPTLIDRQGFTRRRVLATGARLTSAAAQQIADAFLAAHAAVPLRGSLTVRGASVRDHLTNRLVPPSQLGRRIGEAIVIGGQEQDPSSGAIGRVGIIGGVAYDADADTAQIELANSLDFIDAVLQRFALYQS